MKRLTTFALVLSAMFFATSASAYVSEWNYSLSGTFINAVDTNGNPLPNGTTLSWGTNIGNGQSQLVINPSAVSSTVDTYLGGGSVPVANWADSIDLTHVNKPIQAPSLDFATLLVTVILDPSVPDRPALPQQQFTFGIDFTETPNVGVPLEYDIFALLDGFPNFNIQYDAGDGDGLLDYFINVFPSTGGVLSLLEDPHAELAGLDPGTTFGFVTPENQSTTLGFSFTISTRPLSTVPEPSTMLLLGAGLIGLVAIGRKKMRQN